MIIIIFSHFCLNFPCIFFSNMIMVNFVLGNINHHGIQFNKLQSLLLTMKEWKSWILLLNINGHCSYSGFSDLSVLLFKNLLKIFTVVSVYLNYFCFVFVNCIMYLIPRRQKEANLAHLKIKLNYIVWDFQLLKFQCAFML